MFCPICGTNNRDDARFCTNCGFDFSKMQNAGQQPGLTQAAPSPQTAQTYAPGARQPVQGNGAVPYVPLTNVPPMQTAPAPKKSSKKVWPYVLVGGLGAAAVVAAVLFVSGTVPLPAFLGGSTQTAQTQGASTAGSDTSSASQAAATLQVGNSSSAYAGGGLVATDGSYDYFMADGSIYRAACTGSDTSNPSIIVQASSSTESMSNLNIDGDRIYYMKSNGSTSDSATYVLCSAKKDGSDAQELYTLPTSGSSNTMINAVYLCNQKLYIVTYPFTTDATADVTYSVTEVDESGNVIGTSSYKADPSSSATMADGRIFYTYRPAGSNGTTGYIYSQNLDGSDSKVVYTKGNMAIAGTIVADSGKVYFLEYSTQNLSAGYQLAEVGEDGSDYATISVSGVSLASTTSLVGAAKGAVYLLDWSDTTPVLASVSEDGGTAEKTTLPKVLGWGAISTIGDHLLLDDYDSAGSGTLIARYDLNGSQLFKYTTPGRTTSKTTNPVSYDSSTGVLTMPEYGFSVTFPKGLSTKSNSDGTGIILTNYSTGLTISAWARKNTSGETIDSVKAAASVGHEMTYETQSDNGWFVVSYWDGETGHYLREWVNSEREFAIDFTWPKAHNDECTPVIDDMTDTITVS